MAAENLRVTTWAEKIDAALDTADPVLCNLKITLAHRELSLALHDRLGPDTGANFHTWAVWGSKKAGRTIRREDLPRLPAAAAAAGGTLGGSAGVLAARRDRRRGAAAAAAGATAGALAARRRAQRGLELASERILGGNVTVLDDIGRVTARFLDTFGIGAAPDADAVAAFGTTLRPGPPSERGQDLLREAFSHYGCAWRERDADARHEHMLLANLQAILHEHHRLEPYIDEAVPRPLRRAVTARLLDYRVGTNELAVSADIPAFAATGAPHSLDHIDNADLIAFLSGPAGWDRTPDSLAGSAARDWTKLRDRMNYICDLFRSRQFDPALFAQPYDADQVAAIRAGGVPDGPL